VAAVPSKKTGKKFIDNIMFCTGFNCAEGTALCD
jgi:hypothetical protein